MDREGSPKNFVHTTDSSKKIVYFCIFWAFSNTHMKSVVYLCFDWEVGLETSYAPFAPEWYGDPMIHVLIQICPTKRIWSGLGFFFLLLLCFITAKLKSGGIDYFSVLSTDSCDQRKPMFYVTESGSGKQRPRGPMSSISSRFCWDRGGEGKEAEAS